jgi:hypothetical protein
MERAAHDVDAAALAVRVVNWTGPSGCDSWQTANVKVTSFPCDSTKTDPSLSSKYLFLEADMRCS